MDITINEWFYHYLSSDNEKELSMAENILTKIYQRCDRLVFAKGSPLNEKINLLSKINFPKQRNIIKNFFRMFPYNSEKMSVIEKSDLLPLQEELINLLPHRQKDKDKYLVQTCLATHDKIIVTVDKELKQAIDGKYGIKVKLVDEFLEEIRNA